MAEKHPDELELLSFVEEELDGVTHRQVAEHLVACRSCTDEVRRLQAARDVLRAAPLLDPPAGRQEEIIASLPERRDSRRLFRPAKRVLVIAAPVAAAAALVGVFALGGTNLGGGGDDDEAGDAAAEEAVMDQTGGVESAPAPPDGTLVRSVQGPPAAVVDELESEGIAAEVDAQGRVVAEGRLGEVRAALADRPDGNVPVYLR